MLEYKEDYISIWIGVSTKDLEDWCKYTKGIENPRRRPPITKEIGRVDLDFFGIYSTPNNEVVSVKELLKECATQSNETNQKIIDEAKKKGILEGNRMYYHLESFFLEEEKGLLYNDLTFIGNFKDPMR